MIKKKYAVFIVFLIIIHVQVINAADNNSNIKCSNPNLYNATSFYKGLPDIQTYFGICSAYGTHRNAVGIEGCLSGFSDIELLSRINKSGSIQESIGFFTDLEAVYYEKDFGIPGEKFTGKFNLSAIYSAGRKNSLSVKYPSVIGNRKHNFKFGYSGYLTTDSTSQITGQLDYVFIKDNSAFMMNYENDTLLFYLADSYRTAAFKFSYLFDIGSDIIGLSLGFNLWAGERNNLWSISENGCIEIADEVNRENVVTLYNAKEYSVDLVFLSLIFNNYSLSFGYDSELFKEAIHNNIHYVLNDGSLPVLDRPDKFYIEFRIGLPHNLF